MSANGTKSWPRQLRTILVALALFVGAGAAVVTLTVSSAMADTGGYPNASMPCVYPPYATSGTGDWCSKKNAQGQIISDMTWGNNHDDESGANIYSSRSYAYRNCTDYVAWKLQSLGVPSSYYTGLHNGGQWYDYAANKQGLTRGTTPAVGAAAVKPGNPGHVAYVESVTYKADGSVDPNGNISVSEYNYALDGNYHTRSGTAAAMGFTEFVYFGPLMTSPPAGGSGGSTGGSSTVNTRTDVDNNAGSDMVLTTNQPGGGSAAIPALSTYQGFWLQSAWWNDPTVGWTGITPLVGDVNGDHKADYVFLADNTGIGTNAYVALSTGSGFGTPQLWWDGTGFGFGGIKASLADVDGNGGADLVLTTNQPGGGSAAIVLLSTYQGFWYRGAWWADPTVGWAAITPFVDDLNGDHKADYVFLADYNGVGTNAYTALSSGSGFAPPQLWWNGTGYGYGGIKAAMGDVDGNGGADLVLTTNQPGGGSAAIVLLSTYQGFWYRGVWWADSTVGWAGITPFAGDVNGDAKADFGFLANSGVGTNAYVALSSGTGLTGPYLWWNGTGYGFAGIKLAFK